MNNVIASLVAVIITLVLVAGAIEIGETALAQHQAAKAITELEMIRQAANDLAASQGGYDNIGWNQLVTSGGIPPEMEGGLDPWSGGIGVQPIWCSPCLGYEVWFTQVPDAACVALGSYAPGNSSGNWTYGGVYINGSGWNWGQPSAGWITANCSSGWNTIYWIFTD